MTNNFWDQFETINENSSNNDFWANFDTQDSDNIIKPKWENTTISAAPKKNLLTDLRDCLNWVNQTRLTLL